MELFTRVRQVLKRLLAIRTERMEDPAIILREAREAMDREMAKLHPLVAIGTRNELRHMLQERQKRVRDPTPDRVDTEIAELQQALEKAEKDAAAIKESIRTFEAQLRQRAAERLALLGWKQARIEEELINALSGISMWRQHREWERARERLHRKYRDWR